MTTMMVCVRVSVRLLDLMMTTVRFIFVMMPVGFIDAYENEIDWKKTA